jgi:hypothetical protein
MNRTFQQAYHVPGTLTADLAIIFTAHHGLQLTHVSMVCTNAASTTVAIGTTSSAAAYMAAAAVGQSSAPATKTRANFVGEQFPKIATGTVVKLTIDHDGAAGTAGANLTVVLTFTEG